jgi:hypothetical protein
MTSAHAPNPITCRSILRDHKSILVPVRLDISSQSVRNPARRQTLQVHVFDGHRRRAGWVVRAGVTCRSKREPGTRRESPVCRERDQSCHPTPRVAQPSHPSTKHDGSPARRVVLLLACERAESLRQVSLSLRIANRRCSSSSRHESKIIDKVQRRGEARGLSPAGNLRQRCTKVPIGPRQKLNPAQC